MRIFKNNEELRALIVDGQITINDSIDCPFNIDVDANINAYGIKALNINAHNINAYGIKALNINAHNINAYGINAYDINACDINYYSICVAYRSLTCTAIKGRRENSFHKCLDGEIIIKGKEPDIEITVRINGKEAKLSDISAETLERLKSI